MTKKYGFWNSNKDSLLVNLKISDFKNFQEINDRVDEIVCNDSIPIIVLNKSNSIKKISLINPCWKKFACILIREHNVIELYNDSLIKNGKFYSSDSLEYFIKKDYSNNGKDPKFCDKPQKLIFKITADSLKLNSLNNSLDLVTQLYEKTTNKRELKIMIGTHFKPFPFPPPPPAFDINEIVIDQEKNATNLN